MHDAAPGFVQSENGIGSIGDVIPYAHEDWTVYPDPDHWAWWGWFITLLGPSISMTHRPDGTWWVGERRLTKQWWGDLTKQWWGDGVTLGRACIAAAAANGRWPGGEG